MPKLHHLEKLTDNLSIGVQIGTNSDGKPSQQSAGVWTARFSYPRRRPKFKSLKLKYEENSAFNKETAVARAYEYATSMSQIAGSGKDYHQVDYLNSVAEKYLKAIEEYTETNERLKAKGQTLRHKVDGGTGYWHDAMLYQTNIQWKKAILPFFSDVLGTKEKQYVYKRKKTQIQSADEKVFPILKNLTKRDWDLFDDYMVDRVDLDYGVQYRLKCITSLRKFLSWCYEHKYIEDVPSIKRPSTGGEKGTRERMRREVRPEEYTAIIDYQRQRYTDTTRPLYYRQWNYLFHLWTLIIANTGIRPPTGGTEHTLMKWQHVNLGKRPTLERPEEKGKSYTAVIMPNAVTYFEELKKFYEQHNMSTETGYVFAHWRDQGDIDINENVATYTTRTRETGFENYKQTVDAYEAKPAASYRKQLPLNKEGQVRWQIGDPIQSFRAQWNKMIRNLGLHVKGGKQADNISPSSLRSWFITQRLYSDKDFRIEELARVTGTSVGQITERYFRLDMDRSYDHLTAGGYDRGGKKPTYTRDGMYTGFK